MKDSESNKAIRSALASEDFITEAMNSLTGEKVLIRTEEGAVGYVFFDSANHHLSRQVHGVMARGDGLPLMRSEIVTLVHQLDNPDEWVRDAHQVTKCLMDLCADGYVRQLRGPVIQYELTDMDYPDPDQTPE